MAPENKPSRRHAWHALTRVTGAGHSRADWDNVVHMMVNAGAQVPPDQVPVVIDYLAKNFPPKPLPSAPVEIKPATSARL
ncbi:MAG TPA: hypothetical protein VJM79_02310 [Rhizorhapis sp.]|nr:hypothetical protein [Rhizorhapis sp.]